MSPAYNTMILGSDGAGRNKSRKLVKGQVSGLSMGEILSTFWAGKLLWGVQGLLCRVGSPGTAMGLLLSFLTACSDRPTADTTSRWDNGTMPVSLEVSAGKKGRRWSPVSLSWERCPQPRENPGDSQPALLCGCCHWLQYSQGLTWCACSPLLHPITTQLLSPQCSSGQQPFPIRSCLQPPSEASSLFPWAGPGPSQNCSLSLFLHCSTPAPHEISETTYTP